VNISGHSHFVSMHLHVLQIRDIVTVLNVLYFYRNKTKINGHKLFLLGKYSRAGRKTHKTCFDEHVS
jgi:hypothetical protein